MPPLRGSLMLSLILAFVTHSQGMLFSLDTTPDNVYCGRLQCWADTVFTDTNIFSVSVLTIYNVTESSRRVKLASLSVYDPILEQIESNVAATGNISWYHADLTVGLRDPTYCLDGSFLCELDFVNFNRQPGIIRETVSPGSSGNCPAIFSQFAEVAIQIKTQSDEFETEIDELRQEKTWLLAQISCSKGLPYNSSREVFLLWGKMTALCDRETDGGGWIVIQRRTTGDVDFYRPWKDYKNGFGTPETDFWIGNDVIHNLTSQGYTELRVDMEYNGTQYFAHYSHFDVADETSFYRLSVSGYNGTAGNDSLADHDGIRFSTFDNDNDGYLYENCASSLHGAWWYDGNTYCYEESNLNGKWGAQDSTGLAWTGVVESGSVSMSEIKVRHV